MNLNALETTPGVLEPLCILRKIATTHDVLNILDTDDITLALLLYAGEDMYDNIAIKRACAKGNIEIVRLLLDLPPERG